MDELIDIYDHDRRRTGLTVEREQAHMGEGQYMLYVLALVEDMQGRFLVTQRSFEKSWGAGWWEIPGGGVRSGEDTCQALVRELAEEVGLTVADEVRKPVYTYENVDLKRGDNYFVDIYHLRLDFTLDEVRLQDEETIGCDLMTWDEIASLAQAGTFLHFERLRQALEAEGAREVG